MLLLGWLALSAAVDTTALVYSGRNGQLAVSPPRLEETIVLDGVLSDSAWSRAALLTDFSRYAPDDGVPAENRTEVLVWYSPTAMHFGVRAWAAPGSVRATLADRDRMFSDDHLLFFLSTFNDGREALVFGVNPLGVQGDGALVEGRNAGGGGFSGQQVGREPADPSQDFVYESKGRLTEYGFEIEIRIPFKSLRYQSLAVQDWGLSITRRVQSTGHEDSWAPARRSATSFLGQGGTLKGLTGFRRGLVLDVTPVVTSKTTGAAGAAGWEYGGGGPEFGGNVRWGITPNLNLNGTVRPDFAEVESDAGQLVFDPRQALFFPEKRPFFLDGIENFQTPNNLIYTRRITEPLTAVKMAGKVSGTTVGYIGAVDDDAASATGADRPVVNLLRVQRDMGRQNRLGLVYTDRIDGDRSNRVLGVDGRFLFGQGITLQAQAAGSRNSVNGAATTAPLWQATLSRSGRRYAGRVNVRGVHQDFRALSGFISRTGVASMNVSNQLSVYGRRGGRFERGSFQVVLDGTWRYDDFVHARASQDRKLHFNLNTTWRGGWSAGASLLVESFGYDERLYANYAIERRNGAAVDTVPYNTVVAVETARIPNLDWVFRVNTPRVHGVSANGFVVFGRDENFFEWSSADVMIGNLGIEWRPTSQIRVDGTYALQSYKRRTDGSTVAISRIPRVKLEYQVTRAVFVRTVGEFRSDRQDDLRDDGRSNDPVLIRKNASSPYQRSLALGSLRERFRGDALLAVQPGPGTVLFAGYGSVMQGPDVDPLTRGFQRTSDAFFLKGSYLFRMR